MKINNRDCEVKENYFTQEAQPAMPVNMDMNCCRPTEMGETMPGVVCKPIYECPRETVCHRYICHEVPHITPCNTRIINHHIYRHTYTPTYSCCEENEIENIYERRCC